MSKFIAMNKLNTILIILLFTVGLAKAQPQTSQNSFKAAQATVSFKFTTWNTEWLTCTENGPSNEELQINNVVTVIKAMNSDIVALQEVGTSSTYTTIDTLVRRLGDEWAGSMIPTTNDNCGQNEGIIYKKSKVQLVSSSLITTGGSSYNWSSGRFPVLYNVNLLVDGNEIPVSFINIHAKAMSDATSYSRRKGASEGLKTLLDGSTFNTTRIVLLGDFNDYLIGTQCSDCTSEDSPYKNFMDDTSNYKCLTSDLYDTSYNSQVIDNIIISNELFDNYKSNTTTREVQTTESITNYNSTTSDHVPVSASFSMTAGTSACENISFSETFASSLGDFTPYSVDGTQVWSWTTYGATVSGYVTSVNNPNEDWLISPAFDLSGKSSATLGFSHALNYCTSETDKVNNQTLWVSSNYSSGAPVSATWTQLTMPTIPSGSSWVYVNSGDIQLPSEMLQSNVHFAFKYISTSSVAGTWEIKDLTFNTECSSTNISTEVIKSQTTVSVTGKKIKISNMVCESVAVYDITGRILFSNPTVQNIEIPVSQPGVYIVRIGNEVNKVMVR